MNILNRLHAVNMAMIDALEAGDHARLNKLHKLANNLLERI